MSSSPERCSALVADSYGYGFHRCSRKVTVHENGRPYCTQHSPARQRQLAAAREAKLEGTCQYRRPGFTAICGEPAVTTELRYYGRCAKHTQAALDKKLRLETNAEEMYRVLDSLLDKAWFASSDDPLVNAARVVVQRIKFA